MTNWLLTVCIVTSYVVVYVANVQICVEIGRQAPLRHAERIGGLPFWAIPRNEFSIVGVCFSEGVWWTWLVFGSLGFILARRCFRWLPKPIFESRGLHLGPFEVPLDGFLEVSNLFVCFF